MIQSFLLIGQSNMAGRGYLNDVPQILNENIKVLRNGRWQIMFEPIHNDRSTAGVGLSSSFAASWQVHNKELEIGLIPCADGGTSLDDWSIGDALFDHAVAQAKLAMRSSQLAGILWHQGENDSFAHTAAHYSDKFEKIITELRSQLDAPHLPLIIGEIGNFLTNGLYGQYFTSYPKVNEELLRYAQSHAHCYYVTAKNLTANEDQLHFDAKSQRILGLRYYEAFAKLQHITTPLLNEKERVEDLYTRPMTENENKLLLQHRFGSGEISQEEFLIKMKTLGIS